MLLLTLIFLALTSLTPLISAEPIPAAALRSRQITIVEQYCCTSGCGLCNAVSCADFDCFDFPFYSCCAVAVSEKRDEHGSMQGWNSKGEKVTFIED
ncbi:uncharacterized protein LY89DRAFT_728119 [Mollisia scopiformis]|uniref:Uncharacterized protein n=1 Tax=Mollisia scopiformis TaxID=149040 RepID=A0A194XT94_MOLSC|nr:uncharacterized protein LY89DRAFT_728119 [Mollisia scopiformis]KUJ23366.1 hypothetical protein LY89DRAFT_728119 [Mollisia scopiformis]